MAEAKNKILDELKTYFPKGQEYADESVPFDYAILSEDNKVRCYVVFKQNDGIGDKDIVDRIRKSNANQVPTLVARLSDDGEIEMGMLCYWDFDHLRQNDNIIWRTLDEVTIKWLGPQLKAQRRRIAFLPPEYMRVVKTIELNAEGYFDARVIYLRRFHGTDYRMKQQIGNSEEERFERLLHGTPQDDYPVDNLDNYILREIRTMFPNAEKAKNKLLLFDVDLLNYRLEKVNRMQKINIFVQSYETGNADSFNIQLECYYQVNAFRPKVMRERVISSLVNPTDYKELKEIYNTTYEPLSKTNI